MRYPEADSTAEAAHMKSGYITPQNWGLPNPADVIEPAIRAEALGFDSVWVNHHILNVGYIRAQRGDRPYYDALTTLTWVATRTSRVRLGTTVLVLPLLTGGAGALCEVGRRLTSIGDLLTALTD